MNGPDLKEGDTVVSQYGSTQVMTISGIFRDKVECYWFENNKLCEKVFDKKQLLSKQNFNEWKDV